MREVRLLDRPGLRGIGCYLGCCRGVGDEERDSRNELLHWKVVIARPVTKYLAVFSASVGFTSLVHPWALDTLEYFGAQPLRLLRGRYLYWPHSWGSTSAYSVSERFYWCTRRDIQRCGRLQSSVIWCPRPSVVSLGYRWNVTREWPGSYCLFRWHIGH